MDDLPVAASPLPAAENNSIRNFMRATSPHALGVSGAARPRTPRFTFGRPKVNRKTAKTKVLDSFSQSVSIRLGTSLPLNLFLFLIYSLASNDAPAAALLKGYMFLLALDETWFFGCTLGSIRRTTGQVGVLRGIPKGDRRPPLCRCGGGVHRGGTPSKGSRPYAPFCLLFRRGKSRPGPGGGAPKKGVQSVPLWKTIQTAVWAAAPAAAPGDRSTSPGAAWAVHPGASPPAGRPQPPRRWSSRWAGR